MRFSVETTETHNGTNLQMVSLGRIFTEEKIHSSPFLHDLLIVN